MAAFSQLIGYGLRALGGALILGFFGIIKPLQFYARMLVYGLLLAIVGTSGAVISAVLTLAGKQGLSQWVIARIFYYLTSVVLGIKVIVKNPEKLEKRPAVFVSNHQSEFDIFILGATFPQYCSVTAKKVLKYYPFLGWFMALSGSVFIDRANRQNALKTFEGAAKKVHEKQQSVFMYPEGTRSYYQKPGLLPFKKGAFHFAAQAKIPIVPYVTSNYSTICSFQKRKFETGTIVVEVLDPIYPTGDDKESVTELYEQTEKVMTEAVERIGYAEEKKN